MLVFLSGARLLQDRGKNADFDEMWANGGFRGVGTGSSGGYARYKVYDGAVPDQGWKRRIHLHDLERNGQKRHFNTV